jgi:hypothetical protein
MTCSLKSLVKIRRLRLIVGGLSFGVYHLNRLSHFRGAVQLLATANDQGVGVLTTNDKIRAQAMDGQKVRLNDGSMQSRNDLFGQIPIYSVSQGPPPMLLP